MCWYFKSFFSSSTCLLNTVWYEFATKENIYGMNEVSVISVKTFDAETEVITYSCQQFRRLY